LPAVSEHATANAPPAPLICALMVNTMVSPVTTVAAGATANVTLQDVDDALPWSWTKAIGGVLVAVLVAVCVGVGVAVGLLVSVRLGVVVGV
jgi:hypothetical protein